MRARGSRAWLVLLALSWALGARPPAPVRAQQTPSPAADASTEEARQHLRQGRALYEQQNFEGAVVEFESAYRLRPHRDILYNIAQCYERLLQYARARDSYERFAAEAPAGDPDRARALERVGALDLVLGILEVRTNARGAEVWVDGRREGSAPGTLRVSAGRHRIELRARGYIPGAADVQIAGREQRRIEVRLEPTGGARSGIHPAAFFATAGLAVAAAGAGAVLGVRALDLSEQYEANPARSRDDQQSGQDTALAADVLFVGAGVLAVTAGVLLFVTDWGSDGEPAPSHGTGATVTPWLGADRAGVVVGIDLP